LSTKFIAPEPNYTLIQREDEGAPVYAAVNTSLSKIGAEPRQLFSWQLSIIMDLETEDDKGLTLAKEESEIAEFCRQLESELLTNGNALPLARITWKKTRELLFRVYNPAQSDKQIKSIIDTENNPRPFTYSIDPDDKWELADNYLSQFK